MNPEEFPIQRGSDIFNLYDEEEQKVEDQRLGFITPMIAKDPESIQYLRVCRVDREIHGIEMLEACIENTEKRLAYEHENIIQMLDYSYHPIQEEPLEFFFSGFYELAQTDLEREVQFRHRTEKKFSDLEIYTIIREIASGLAFLQRYNLVHGDLRPMYISMSQQEQNVDEMDPSEIEDDSQKFVYKLVDRLGHPTAPQQVQVINIREDADLYITPHFFESLFKEVDKIKINPFKQDVFALGMIVLFCGLMTDTSAMYDTENGLFRYETLEEFKKSFIQLYNDSILIELIELLLETDEAKRLTPIKLINKMDEILANLENEEVGEKKIPESVEEFKMISGKESVEKESEESESGSDESDSDSDTHESEEEVKVDSERMENISHVASEDQFEIDRRDEERKEDFEENSDHEAHIELAENFEEEGSKKSVSDGENILEHNSGEDHGMEEVELHSENDRRVSEISESEHVENLMDNETEKSDNHSSKDHSERGSANEEESSQFEFGATEKEAVDSDPDEGLSDGEIQECEEKIIDVGVLENHLVNENEFEEEHVESESEVMEDRQSEELHEEEKAHSEVDFVHSDSERENAEEDHSNDEHVESKIEVEEIHSDPEHNENSQNEFQELHSDVDPTEDFDHTEDVEPTEDVDHKDEEIHSDAENNGSEIEVEEIHSDPEHSESAIEIEHVDIDIGHIEPEIEVEEVHSDADHSEPEPEVEELHLDSEHIEPEEEVEEVHTDTEHIEPGIEVEEVHSDVEPENEVEEDHSDAEPENEELHPDVEPENEAEEDHSDIDLNNSEPEKHHSEFEDDLSEKDNKIGEPYNDCETEIINIEPEEALLVETYHEKMNEAMNNQENFEASDNKLQPEEMNSNSESKEHINLDNEDPEDEISLMEENSEKSFKEEEDLVEEIVIDRGSENEEHIGVNVLAGREVEVTDEEVENSFKMDEGSFEGNNQEEDQQSVHEVTLNSESNLDDEILDNEDRHRVSENRAGQIKQQSNEPEENEDSPSLKSENKEDEKYSERGNYEINLDNEDESSPLIAAGDILNEAIGTNSEERRESEAKSENESFDSERRSGKRNLEDEPLDQEGTESKSETGEEDLVLKELIIQRGSYDESEFSEGEKVKETFELRDSENEDDNQVQEIDINKNENNDYNDINVDIEGDIKIEIVEENGENEVKSHEEEITSNRSEPNEVEELVLDEQSQNEFEGQTAESVESEVKELLLDEEDHQEDENVSFNQDNLSHDETEPQNEEHVELEIEMVDEGDKTDEIEELDLKNSESYHKKSEQELKDEIEQDDLKIQEDFQRENNNEKINELVFEDDKPSQESNGSSEKEDFEKLGSENEPQLQEEDQVEEEIQKGRLNEVEEIDLNPSVEEQSSVSGSHNEETEENLVQDLKEDIVEKVICSGISEIVDIGIDMISEVLLQNESENEEAENETETEHKNEESENEDSEKDQDQELEQESKPEEFEMKDPTEADIPYYPHEHEENKLKNDTEQIWGQENKPFPEIVAHTSTQFQFNPRRSDIITNTNIDKQDEVYTEEKLNDEKNKDYFQKVNEHYTDKLNAQTAGHLPQEQPELAVQSMSQLKNKDEHANEENFQKVTSMPTQTAGSNFGQEKNVRELSDQDQLERIKRQYFQKPEAVIEEETEKVIFSWDRGHLNPEIEVQTGGQTFEVEHIAAIHMDEDSLQENEEVKDAGNQFGRDVEVDEHQEMGSMERQGYSKVQVDDSYKIVPQRKRISKPSPSFGQLVPGYSEQTHQNQMYIQNQPTEHKQAQYKTAEHQPAEQHPVEYTSVQHRPVQHKPTEYIPREHISTEYNPREHTTTEYKPIEEGYINSQPTPVYITSPSPVYMTSPIPAKHRTTQSSFNKKPYVESNVFKRDMSPAIKQWKKSEPRSHWSHQENRVDYSPMKRKSLENKYTPLGNSIINAQELPITSIVKNPQNITQVIKVILNPENQKKRIVLMHSSNQKKERLSMIKQSGTFKSNHKPFTNNKQYQSVQVTHQSTFAPQNFNYHTSVPVNKNEIVTRNHSIPASANHQKVVRTKRISLRTENPHVIYNRNSESNWRKNPNDSYSNQGKLATSRIVKVVRDSYASNASGQRDYRNPQSVAQSNEFTQYTQRANQQVNHNFVNESNSTVNAHHNKPETNYYSQPIGQYGNSIHNKSSFKYNKASDEYNYNPDVNGNSAVRVSHVIERNHPQPKPKIYESIVVPREDDNGLWGTSEIPSHSETVEKRNSHQVSSNQPSSGSKARPTIRKRRFNLATYQCKRISEKKISVPTQNYDSVKFSSYRPQTPIMETQNQKRNSNQKHFSRVNIDRHVVYSDIKANRV